MRRIKTLLIICNLVIGCLAQTQQGMAYRYNGKSPRTPLSNVTIVYDENKRSTISAENGSFALTLVGRKMGDRIGQVTVKKREMMVFNQSAVDEWSVRKDPLMLILCNTDEFERQKENLIAIGKREAKKKYDKQKADLESQLSASKIKAAEYEAALDKAYEDLERLQKNIGEYADLFARIDESEIDTLAQRAVDLFNHGEVDEAIMLFEQGHYMEKLKKAKELKQQARIAKAQIDQAEAKANEDSLIAVQSIRAQIEAYKLKNDWNNVGELLKGLADELGTIRENWDYAAFSGDQNDYKEAEIYFERTLNLVEEKEVGEEYLIDKGKLLNSLGTIYTNTQRLKEAEVKYKDALEIFRSLSKTNPNEHNENLCNVLNNLAILYYITQQMENSEAFFVEGLDVSREMAEYDAKKYQPDYARALNNMAIFYMNLRKYDDSEGMYIKALEIFKNLASTDSLTNNTKIAMILTNLAMLYENTNRLEESSKYYAEATDMMKKMVEINLSAYEPSLARILYQSAKLQKKMKKSLESEETYLKSLAIYRKLAKSNASVYDYYVAMTLNGIADLYNETSRTKESEDMYLEALEIRRRLAMSNPSAYQSDVAMTLFNLGSLYSKIKQIDKAETACKEALAIYKDLAVNAPNRFDFYVIKVLYLFADCKILANKFVEAEQFTLQGLEIDPEQHDFFSRLAAALLFQGKYAEAEKIYRQYKEELKDSFLDDLKEYAEAGVIPHEYEADVEKIIQLLEE